MHPSESSPSIHHARSNPFTAYLMAYLMAVGLIPTVLQYFLGYRCEERYVK